MDHPQLSYRVTVDPSSLEPFRHLHHTYAQNFSLSHIQIGTETTLETGPAHHCTYVSIQSGARATRTVEMLIQSARLFPGCRIVRHRYIYSLITRSLNDPSTTRGLRFVGSIFRVYIQALRKSMTCGVNWPIYAQSPLQSPAQSLIYFTFLARILHDLRLPEATPSLFVCLLSNQQSLPETVSH